MKACVHCGEPIAAAARLCPSCGAPKRVVVGPLFLPKDEPLGFERPQGLTLAIIFALGLGITMALMWFLR